MLQIYFDRFAIALSGICTIHCIALPLFVGLIPLLSTATSHSDLLHEFWFHQFILVFILPVSIFALISGYKCHKRPGLILIGATGLVILVTVALFADYFIAQKIMTSLSETLLTITGGIIHAAGHVANILNSKGHHANN